MSSVATSAPEVTLVGIPNVVGVVLTVYNLWHVCYAAGASETLNTLVMLGLFGLFAYYNVAPATQGKAVEAQHQRVVPTAPTCKVAYLGLGRMGSGMAQNLAKQTNVTLHVWNRTDSKTVLFEQKHPGVRGFDKVEEAVEDCDFVFLCLPTTKDVVQICERIENTSPEGKRMILVDCTSGDPKESRELAKSLAKKNIDYIDAPVSGGPHGAEKATLTIMAGANSESVFLHAKPVLDVLGAKVIRVGSVGCGNAVKAVNNAMMASALLLSAEGLCALANYGVDANTALSVINSSSGRNLATQERFPKHILTRSFDFGFALGLLKKDSSIASRLLPDSLKDGYIDKSTDLLKKACEDFGEDSDFTSAVRVLEAKVGVELK